MARLDRSEVGSWQLPLRLPRECSGPRTWSSSAAFPGQYQGAGRQVEQLKQEPVFTMDAKATG